MVICSGIYRDCALQRPLAKALCCGCCRGAHLSSPTSVAEHAACVISGIVSDCCPGAEVSMLEQVAATCSSSSSSSGTTGPALQEQLREALDGHAAAANEPYLYVQLSGKPLPGGSTGRDTGPTPLALLQDVIQAQARTSHAADGSATQSIGASRGSTIAGHLRQCANANRWGARP